MPKILIVEDDVEIAMLERDYLRIEGFETQTVSDGEAAADPGAPAATGGQGQHHGDGQQKRGDFFHFVILLNQVLPVYDRWKAAGNHYFRTSRYS